MVRGLDYYSKTVFEIHHGSLGGQNALCGGGRYDYLVEELGGDKTSAIGFAAWLERLLMVADLDEKAVIKNYLNKDDDLMTYELYVKILKNNNMSLLKII